MNHHESCGGVWCMSGPTLRDMRWAKCRKCGVVVTSATAWFRIDPDAYDQIVDPDGLQRAFLQTCGLEATRR